MEGLRWGSGVIRRGRRAGQIMPVQSAGLRGGGGLVPAPGIVVRKGGHSLDTVREHLQQDPRWKHLDNLTDLLVILEDAVLKGHAENTGEVVTVGSAPSVWSTLEGLFEVKPGSQWWTNRAAPPAAPRGPAEELARSWEEGGDPSFNPDEFFQRLFGTPLFDLVDQDVADEAARVEADAVAELPPPAVVPVPEAIVLPPPGELLTRTDYNASLRTTYFDEAGTPRATTSRVAPQTAAIPPVGTWMLEDTYPLMDGHEIEQLVELPIDAIGDQRGHRGRAVRRRRALRAVDARGPRAAADPRRADRQGHAEDHGPPPVAGGQGGRRDDDQGLGVVGDRLPARGQSHHRADARARAPGRGPDRRRAGGPRAHHLPRRRPTPRGAARRARRAAAGGRRARHRRGAATAPWRRGGARAGAGNPDV